MDVISPPHPYPAFRSLSVFSFQVPPGHSCLLLQVLELKGNKLACSLSQKVVFFCPRKGPFKGLFQLCSGSYCAKEQTRLFFRTLKNQDFFFFFEAYHFSAIRGHLKGVHLLRSLQLMSQNLNFSGRVVLFYLT